VRYQAEGEPLYAGFCYCEDCRRASGAGAVPFMGYKKQLFRVAGETKQARMRRDNQGENRATIRMRMRRRGGVEGRG
jgi:hypothetical protein